MGAIYNFIRAQPKYALDTDIEKCFDRINWNALLEKLQTTQEITRLIRAWLKAGILDEGRMFFPTAGTPQGGPLSPLLCNVALHGLETQVAAVSKQHRVTIIRYADDLVVLCKDLETLQEAQRQIEGWLAGMGLQLKPSKTRVTHTLQEYEGNCGFDFLGFNVRQYRVGKYHTYTYRGEAGFKTLIKPSQEAIRRHSQQLRAIIRQYRGAPQAGLVRALNPVIRGWSMYYQSCVAKRAYTRLDYTLFHQLRQWTRQRHQSKTGGWRKRRYWRRQGNRRNFSDGNSTLTWHVETPIRRHVKVQSAKSPYDGDWVYWGERLKQDPTKPGYIIKLLKQQESRCAYCGLHFTTADVIEVHHQDGNRQNNQSTNLVLLHGHCHDQSHGQRCR